ncbi:hypothetical protein ABZ743_32530 [Streptomyces sp. NPDC006662]|uniref:hypothetical protein n=1 Tax=Streptomyces sp. NPDC006662 TaxID=3156902 RepID=UPI0033D69AD1
MTQDGQDDDRLAAGIELAPSGAEPVAALPYETGDKIDGRLRQREPDLVDSIARALGGLVCLHT